MPPAPGPQQRAARGRAPALAEGPPALAVFDVEGVVLDTTVAHFYAWLRTRDMPELDQLVWTRRRSPRACPAGCMADRRSRAAFNRSFYRALPRPAGARAARAGARRRCRDFIQPRIQHEAVRRIREHQRRGDRVVLVTGALDFLVELAARTSATS